MAGEQVFNFVVAIILVAGGIASTFVALYPRMSFDETTRYVEPEKNITVNPMPLLDKDESKPHMAFGCQNCSMIIQIMFLCWSSICHVQSSLLIREYPNSRKSFCDHHSYSLQIYPLFIY